MERQPKPYLSTSRGRSLAVLVAISCFVISWAAWGGGMRQAPKPTKARTMPPWRSSTLNDQLASLDDQASYLEDKNDALQGQITEASSTLAKTVAVQGAKLQAGGSVPPAEQTEEAAESEPDQGARETESARQQLAQQAAALGNLQTDLRNLQSLLQQTHAAKELLKDATNGDESVYQDILHGKFDRAAGVYAKRATSDAGAGTVDRGGGQCGDYPAGWCHAPPDSIIYFGGGSHLNRECVAYAGWARYSHHQPLAFGDAGDWPGRSQTPTVGSVAVWNRGTVSPYGHVAYVTAVAADSITISEFNWHPYVYSSRTIKRNGSGWPSRFWP
ncbi:MAG: CHAP domain-containing protein [Elusimicrobia bacterium]|nr:CHAP domain-containing protein [Elusimicrobiota bacterium]